MTNFRASAGERPAGPGRALAPPGQTASRRQEHQARRRLEREREARRARLRRLARRVGLPLVLGGLVLTGGIWWLGRPRPGTSVPSQGNAHLGRVGEPHEPYNSDPPTSGPHLGGGMGPWGISREPIPKELLVHNLEDGGIIIHYGCTDCPDLVAKLEAIARRYNRHVVMAPYPGLKSRIALTAWTRIDALDEFDEARIARFIDAYQGVDHHVRTTFGSVN